MRSKSGETPFAKTTEQGRQKDRTLFSAHRDASMVLEPRLFAGF